MTTSTNTPLMLSAKSSISSNSSFVVNNPDDPRPARLRLGYGQRRKGSNLTNSSSIERPRTSTYVGRQRCFSGDSYSYNEPISVQDVYEFQHPSAVCDSIDDALENLDIELTEYEKLIMNKYLQEMQPSGCAAGEVEQNTDQNETEQSVINAWNPNNKNDDEIVLTRFPVNEPIRYENEYFPAKDQKYSFAHIASPPPSSPHDNRSTNDIRSDTSTTAPNYSSSQVNFQSFGTTAAAGEVRNCRVNRNQPNNRSALRKNFSIWVGVTSCVWGLLLYLEKSYS